MTTADAEARRVGVMGGAFDPPHLAHVALAQAACEQLQLDQLRLIPTGQAWHKPQPLTAACHRLAMAELAFADLPKVTLDRREMARDGPSYTIDTLRELAVSEPGVQWFLIIGADQARALCTWKAWHEILQSAIICVADRAYSIRAGALFDAEMTNPARFRHLDMPAMAISATEIRARISANLDIHTLVCEPVARYIAAHHLYQTV
ncbi:MAG: nicotinate-nucleotide adenylyltransferase [Rhodoferax sp.]